MTEEEKLAEEYVDEKWCSDCEIDCICWVNCPRKMDFIAGYEAGKPKWHNLRKNPNDLPTEGAYIMSGILLLRIKLKGSNAVKYELGKYSFADREFHYAHIIGIDEVVEWCEIPKHEE